ncbi:hypothetical protein D922_00044 [Enterococcus faecalis 06-MB-DW-09]|nr:hypothetical protein [Enterococcus innesii]EPH97917.1 hypothetical protein D922_00044 [Enterococcus faecalis 06-MB-DW-09]
MNLRDILNDAAEVKPAVKTKRKALYSFEDAQALNKANALQEKVTGHVVDAGNPQLAPDGYTYMATPTKNVATDLDQYFENRFRKVSEEDDISIVEVVTDYRAIKEQASGQIYTTNVKVYEIEIKKKKLSLKSVKLISDDEFVNGFKEKLNQKSMEKVLVAIQAQAAGSSITETSLAI